MVRLEVGILFAAGQVLFVSMLGTMRKQSSEPVEKVAVARFGE